MAELRWALLILGLLLLAGIYLYSRRQGSRRGSGSRHKARTEEWSEPVISGEALWGNELEGEEPTLDETEDVSLAEYLDQKERPPHAERQQTRDGDVEISVETESRDVVPETQSMEQAGEEQPPAPERIIAMRVAAPSGRTLSAEEMVLKLRQLGLRHGKYGIFHRYAEDSADPPIFSVANMTEPGSFNLTTLRETRLPGVSLFLVLPNSKDPVDCFEDMVETARTLARDLNGEILDENGSTWSIQRERYVREELIRYRVRHDRSSGDR